MGTYFPDHIEENEDFISGEIPIITDIGILCNLLYTAGCCTRSDENYENLCKLPYVQYLKSKHWIQTSKNIRWLDRERCQRCGSNVSLCVHHYTYENIGKEPYRDLTTLCKACHREIHLWPTRYPELHKGRMPNPKDIIGGGVPDFRPAPRRLPEALVIRSDPRIFGAKKAG